MRIYGPVPSRRFGLSLGIDLVPHKTCPFDCIYCQLGPTNHLSTQLEEFFTLEEILADVQTAFKKGPRPDVITMAGAGEPTLYARLDELIDALHDRFDIPVLLITNAALLWRDDVARAAMKADILAPSLDAGDPETFARINRPHPDITFERLIEGLEKVTRAHPGEVRLEIMLVQGMNDSDESLGAIAAILPRLRFDRIDINTPVRPSAYGNAHVCDESVLKKAMALFGPTAHPIASFIPKRQAGASLAFGKEREIQEMLMRRPCTAADVAASLGLHPHEAAKALQNLLAQDLIESRISQGEIYYHVPGRDS